MKKLKILQVINVRWYNAEADYCLKLARSLKALDTDVTVMGIKGSPVIDMAERDGLKTISNIDINSQNPAGIFLNYFRLKSALKTGQFDIVNFHRSEGFIVGALACKAAKIRVVRTRGDMRPVRKGCLNKLLYNTLTDFIISSGDIIKRGLIDRLKSPEEKTRTIYTAVDTNYFTPEKRSGKLIKELSVPDGSKIIAILGRLGNVKGHSFFIKAARLIKDDNENARFLIIGKDVENDMSDLKGLIEELGLKGDVHFIMGKRADIDEILADADLGVITSTASEANCRVAAEWMSSAIPVVGFAAGVIPEVVTDGVDGFVVPVGDYQALARKITCLIKDTAKWQSFSENARRDAKEKYNLEKIGRDTLSVYEEIVSSSA
jgi:glycosyltransferase involved in cell wall biosynthesis